MKAELGTRIGDVRIEVERVRTEAEKGRAELGTRIDGVRAEGEHVRTMVEQVRTAVASLESKLIKWFIATLLACLALSLSIAKFIR